MLIFFHNTKIQKEFSDEKLLIRRWGPEQAKLIKRRLAELGAAENLDDLRKLPQIRAHELIRDRTGQISLDIKYPYRLIIVPDYEKKDIPRNKDGGLDWQKITKIKVLEIADTHD